MKQETAIKNLLVYLLGLDDYDIAIKSGKITDEWGAYNTNILPLLQNCIDTLSKKPKVKIKIGDIITDGLHLGVIKDFQRNGAWVVIRWQTFTDVFNTKQVYKLLREKEWKIYKEV